MRDNKPLYLSQKTYRDGREAPGICFECKCVIEGDYVRVEFHLMCEKCWEYRFGRIMRHQTRVQKYLKKHGNVFDKEGNPVDAPGKSLKWLMNKYPKDYSIQELIDYGDQ